MTLLGFLRGRAPDARREGSGLPKHTGNRCHRFVFAAFVCRLAQLAGAGERTGDGRAS
ncbi:Uncharacterised protein [Pannonibacter phragmitetus]|uniref:Uncharacterized protein n=1 Tax=Pannonibacter phragmitetus TaxID=121719 RepID=A0A378ZSS6_9HYPH|nr:Uncharacterised protein [Pannonibacter phragmitetus]